MSQNSPFGQPVDDEAGDRPVVATTPAPAEKSNRTALLAIGATAVALVAGVGGFFLLSGGSSDVEASGTNGFTPVATSPTEAPTPTPSATPLPTESTVNARNPFLGEPTPTPTATTTTSTSASTTSSTEAGNGNGTGTGTGSGSGSGGGTTSPTQNSTAVIVTMVKWDADSHHASFKVISSVESGNKVWSVDLGGSFGKPLNGSVKPFKYDGVVTMTSGKECPSVKYVDSAAARVCLGDIVAFQ